VKFVHYVFITIAVIVIGAMLFNHVNAWLGIGVVVSLAYFIIKKLVTFIKGEWNEIEID
jgi:hypothetical protein